MSSGADGSGSSSKQGKSVDLVTVAAAVATGLGTLGWVAFVGGAILWISFLRAHLPAAEAVAKVPTAVLVSTGAEFVVAAILAAAIIIGALYGFDVVLRRITRAQAGKQQANTAGARHPTRRGGVGQAGEGDDEVVTADTPRSLARLWVILPPLLLFLASVVAALLVNLGYERWPGTWGFVWICFAALFAALIGSALYSNTDSFPVIGLVALIAVPLVMGVATYFRATDEPRVEPVALLKTDGTPLVGFLVAETSDRVYVGTFEQDAPDPCALVRHQACTTEFPRIRVPARLLSLPSSEVRDLTVGPSIPLNAKDALEPAGRPRTARVWAAGAALRLCKAAVLARRKAEAVAASSAATDETLPATCSDEDINFLRRFDERERNAIGP